MQSQGKRERVRQERKKRITYWLDSLRVWMVKRRFPAWAINRISWILCGGQNELFRS